MRNSLVFFLLIASSLASAQTAPAPTPAETGIAEANQAIASQPKLPEGYDLLASALLRRARETCDASYILHADEAAKKAVQLAPDNFEGQRTQVSVLVAQHDYPAALEQAKVLNKRTPDDVLTYGLLTVANAELGNYDAAENAAQWMLNLRPGNVPAFINTAYLRELFGDPDGAYEMLDLALESTAPLQTEDRAWILTRMAHMRLISGRADSADSLLHRALDVFPDYCEALPELAEVRLAQKRYDEAIGLLKQAEPTKIRAASLYRIAEAMELAGHGGEAQHVFKEFERRADAESATGDNANRELVLYYADHAHQPSKALQLARQELAWRHDVYTLDGYAWALHVNGQDIEARKQIETALAVGIRDATLFRHAGEIALKLGDRTVAESYLKQSVALNPADSERSRITLASLSPARRR